MDEPFSLQLDVLFADYGGRTARLNYDHVCERMNVLYDYSKGHIRVKIVELICDGIFGFDSQGRLCYVEKEGRIVQ